MPSNDHSPWIKKPQQERSRRTLKRLLDAAEEMLAEGSFDQATIPLIVARAGSSVGSFYSLFRGKEALFECLMDRHEERTLQHVEQFCAQECWRTASFADKAAAWVKLVVGHCFDEQGVMRARLMRNISDPMSIPEHRRQKVRAIIDQVLGFFSPNLDELSCSRPKEALSFALMCVDYVATYRILIEDPQGRYFGKMGRNHLAEQLTALMLAYVAVLD